MKRKKVVSLLLCGMLCFGTFGCTREIDNPDEPEIPDNPTEPGGEDAYAYRVDRDFTAPPRPDNTIDEAALPAANEEDLGNNSMTAGNVTLSFVQKGGGYGLSVTDSSGREMFAESAPAKLYIKGGEGLLEGQYTDLVRKDYGYLASVVLTTEAGSALLVEDRYYFPPEGENAINVAKQVTVQQAESADTGFESIYSLSSSESASGDYDWFVPNNIFSEADYGTKVYRETYLGVPMIMMRNRETGDTLSLARYQPVIHYENNEYASLTLTNAEGSGSISVEYPTRDTARRYHSMKAGVSHAMTLCFRAETTPSHSEAIIASYNAHFNLQNQRIVNTDIDEVYRVVCEDYKTFLQKTEQTNPETGKKYDSYGLPWRITIEDGEIGPLTYQAGFIGQQIPSAYNMMLYGIMNDDYESLQNGVNVVDFWVNGAEFMSAAGVPYIWYDTWADGFRSYPCFLRMAVDALEGLLDAYRLAEAHGIERYEWYQAIELFANFLVNNQNADGSWYRCYNYDGGPFVNWDNGIEEPSGNICQSFSKLNTNLPVRFLVKMYEYTGAEKYKDAALAAGEFVYREIYPSGVYTGGTCDNPNRVDKESGVYAMYCFDALYLLTGEARWLECLRHATAFTMSTVQIYSYPVKDSPLKAAYPCEYGYNDGMSFICTNSTGADNYIAYIYYELFRIYILTGDRDYLKQAEFVQQNTKSIMNWDGTLGYKYKSLVAEATTTTGFTFSSASDGAWVTWSSVANIEPIAKMYVTFGKADVMEFSEVPIEELRARLEAYGVGGHAHKVFENTVAEKIS